jgi:excisionase family DNA binding protein
MPILEVIRQPARVRSRGPDHAVPPQRPSAVTLPTARRSYFRQVAAPAGEPERDHEPGVPALLTVAEACAALRVSRWTLYRLIQTRRLATIRIGTKRLVPAPALGALIDRLGQEELH